MQLGLRVPVFSYMWVLLQDISDLIRLSRTVQRTYFIIYEFSFTCFKVEYKRSYIFSKFWYLDMDLNSEVHVCGLLIDVLEI